MQWQLRRIQTKLWDTCQEKYQDYVYVYIYLIKNSQAVKKGAAPKKAMVKKDVKSKVAAKKWLWW